MRLCVATPQRTVHTHTSRRRVEADGRRATTHRRDAAVASRAINDPRWRRWCVRRAAEVATELVYNSLTCAGSSSGLAAHTRHGPHSLLDGSSAPRY